MSAEVSFEAAIAAVLRMVNEVEGGHGIRSGFEACLDPIAKAIQELEGFNDDHAAQAASLARSAGDAARTVSMQDLAQYARSGRELVRTLQG